MGPLSISWTAPMIRLEGPTGQRGDRTADAVQDIALEESPDLGSQAFRPCGHSEIGNTLDSGREFHLLLAGHFEGSYQFSGDRNRARSRPGCRGLPRL
jgi:hypothetical protein